MFWKGNFRDESAYESSNTGFTKDHFASRHLTQIISLEKDKDELETIAQDLNRLYERYYKAKPFRVEQADQHTPIQLTTGGLFSDPGYSNVKKIWVLKFDESFDWCTDRYTRMLHDILDSVEQIVVEVVTDKPNGSEPDGYDDTKGIPDLPVVKSHGFIDTRRGGYTPSPYRVYLSKALKKYIEGESRSGYNYAGVLIHELLAHIHPHGDLELNSNDLKSYYDVTEGGNHKGYTNRNTRIISDKEELKELKYKH